MPGENSRINTHASSSSPDTKKHSQRIATEHMVQFSHSTALKMIPFRDEMFKHQSPKTQTLGKGILCQDTQALNCPVQQGRKKNSLRELHHGSKVSVPREERSNGRTSPLPSKNLISSLFFLHVTDTLMCFGCNIPASDYCPIPLFILLRISCFCQTPWVPTCPTAALAVHHIKNSLRGRVVSNCSLIYHHWSSQRGNRGCVL